MIPEKKELPTVGAICDLTAGDEPPAEFREPLQEGKCPRCGGAVRRWIPPIDMMGVWFLCFTCRELYDWPMAWEPPIGISCRLFPKWLTPTWWAWYKAWGEWDVSEQRDSRGRFVRAPRIQRFTRVHDYA